MQIKPPTGLETKVASAPASAEITEAFDSFMQAFDSFKQANDERLAQVERRMSGDIVTVEKVERINAALDEQKRVLDELALKNARPWLDSSHSLGLQNIHAGAHKAAFDSYMRKREAHGLAGLEAKALSVGTGADGGYLVRTELLVTWPDVDRSTAAELLAKAAELCPYVKMPRQGAPSVIRLAP